MTKEEFIENYIVSFMSTYDANHVCRIHDEVTITDCCSYETAREAAKRAWVSKANWYSNQTKLGINPDQDVCELHCEA